MLTLYRATSAGLQLADDAASGDALGGDIAWIDLNEPAAEESARVAKWLGVDLPSREDMQEIEVSSRIYEDDSALVMIFSTLINVDADHPAMTEVALIVTDRAVVTIRYAEPRWFAQFVQRSQKLGANCSRPVFVAITMFETVIDRIADVLEKTSLDADAVSRSIFDRQNRRPINGAVLRDRITRISRVVLLSAKARESLITISRAVVFLTASSKSSERSRAVKAHLAAARNDAEQLAGYTNYLSDKASFLLDATVGLINIEQNNIIKFFSIAATAMMPPTLIASVYGMNFHHMPELDVPWAYPVVILAMVAAAVLPYFFFRFKGWL